HRIRGRTLQAASRLLGRAAFVLGLAVLLGSLAGWGVASPAHAQTSPVDIALVADQAVAVGQPAVFGYASGSSVGLIRSISIVFGDGTPAQTVFTFDPTQP